MRRIGVHTSIAGGLHCSLERARELGCNTLQIFSHNPRRWSVKGRGPDEIRSFRKLRKTYDIAPVFIHTSYLINLASRDRDLIGKSIDMIIFEMNIADEIGADYIVLHTGSAAGEDPKTARKRAIDCLSQVSEKGKWNAGLLLENTAGERGDVTSKIREISEISDKTPAGLVSGICVDTCHAFSAGYDFRSIKGMKLISDEIDQYIGREKIKLLHLNDSKGVLGCRVDRHEHIGKGKIGMKGFRDLLNYPFFWDIPIILETPKKLEDDDKKNLKVVRNFIN